MSIYTIKLNHPGNNDFQLLGVVTKDGLDDCSPSDSSIPVSLLKYKNTTFDHTPWLVPETTDGENVRFSAISELESLKKIETRVISAKLTRSFSGDNFTASLPPDHPLRDCIDSYRTGIYIFENNILIWKGEVIQTTKKLSGELTLKAVGMTDIINYFCPIKQTFRNRGAADIIRCLVRQYHCTVSNFRRVLIDPAFYTAGYDDPMIEEYACDGRTPLLSIIKDLTMVNRNDSGHWYVVMEDADRIKNSMNFDFYSRSDEQVPMSFFTEFYASAGLVPMIKYGYASDVNISGESNMFLVKYGENLMDLKLEQKADNPTMYIYEADQVEVITAGIREAESDENSDSEELETEFYWKTETVPFYPDLYRVNTSKEWDENTQEWVDSEETIHPIRYADINHLRDFIYGPHEGFGVNLITGLNDLASLCKLPETEEGEEENSTEKQYILVNPSDYENIPQSLFPDIDWMNAKYFPYLNEGVYLEGPLTVYGTGCNDSYIPTGIVQNSNNKWVALMRDYALGEKPMHYIFDYSIISSNSQPPPDKDFGNLFPSAGENPQKSEYMYLSLESVPAGSCVPIGAVTSKETIRLDGVSDHESFNNFTRKLNRLQIPQAVSVSYSCEAIDLSLFDNTLVKAELGGYAKVSATPNTDEFTGVITSITYDIVNSKKSVSIQKESESITDVIAKALDRRSVLEKRFAIKSNVGDITEKEIKSGDVIFIPE